MQRFYTPGSVRQIAKCIGDVAKDTLPVEYRFEQVLRLSIRFFTVQKQLSLYYIVKSHLHFHVCLSVGLVHSVTSTNRSFLMPELFNMRSYVPTPLSC